jgi:hypothetical protein
MSVSLELDRSECAICQGSQEGSLAVLHKVSDTVSHVFHPDCITPWLQSNHDCPLCSESLTDRELVHFIQLPTNDEWVRHNEIIKAIEANNLPELKKLVAIGNLNDVSLMEAFLVAADVGHLEIFDWLSSVAPVLTTYHSTSYRISAFRLAGAGGHCEIARRLLDGGPVSQDGLDTTFQISIQDNHLDMLELLLSRNLVSKELAHQALFFAAENGFSGIVELLLRHVPISESDRNSLIVISAPNGHQEVVDLVVKSGPISIESRSAAVWAGARFGCRGIVAALLASGPILAHVQTATIECAQRKNYKEIVDMLRACEVVEEKP